MSTTPDNPYRLLDAHGIDPDSEHFDDAARERWIDVFDTAASRELAYHAADLIQSAWTLIPSERPTVAPLLDRDEALRDWQELIADEAVAVRLNIGGQDGGVARIAAQLHELWAAGIIQRPSESTA